MSMTRLYLTLFILFFMSACSLSERQNESQRSLAAATSSPFWWKDSVFYEIFVRSFQDSNGDGIGDLKGITKRLDYLAGLGIDGLWLTPVFLSNSYHGYDAIDYHSIDPAYGSDADFRELITEAHNRGIKVILDLALNHTSNKHPWFQKALQDENSSEHARYIFKPEIPPGWPPKSFTEVKRGSRHEFYYHVFSPGLPDLNWENQEVVSVVRDILHFWVNRGVDGFRLDAARYYIEEEKADDQGKKTVVTADTPGTHAKIQEFATELKDAFPNRDLFFVGEIFESMKTISTYVKSPNELDLAFNFPTSFALIHSIQSGQAKAFTDAMSSGLSLGIAQDRLAPFTTNHDLVRIASQLDQNKQKLALAATGLLTLPGTPFLYYGEEIGMPNTNPSQNDLGKRTPMLWEKGTNHGFTCVSCRPWNAFSIEDDAHTVEAQAGVKGSLLETYRTLIQNRKSIRSLRHGNLEVLKSADPTIAVYLRRLHDETSLIILNFGSNTSKEIQLSFDLGSLPSSGIRSQQLFGKGILGSVIASQGKAQVSYQALPATSGAIIQMK